MLPCTLKYQQIDNFELCPTYTTKHSSIKGLDKTFDHLRSFLETLDFSRHLFQGNPRKIDWIRFNGNKKESRIELTATRQTKMSTFKQVDLFGGAIAADFPAAFGDVR